MTTEKQSIWKTRRAKNVGLGMLVLAVAGLVGWWIFLRPYVATEDARVAMTLVRVAPSGVSGRIEKLNVIEGSKVKKGDVLVELDHRVPQANYDRAKAKYELSKRELDRQERMYREGAATPQAFDTVRSNAEAARADLALAEVALENTYLKSPFDGVVVQKPAEVGNLLEAGQTAVVVADEDHAWVNANIEETSVGAIKPGQPVRITVDEGGGTRRRSHRDPACRSRAVCSDPLR